MGFHDLRIAARALRKSLGFTVVAILILGTGISGIVASFSVVDSFLMTPLPFENPQELVHLYRTDPQSGFDQGRFSLPMVAALQSSNAQFQDLAAYTYSGRNLADSEQRARACDRQHADHQSPAYPRCRSVAGTRLQP